VANHVPDLPRTVHLVAQAPALHIVGFGNAVLAAQIAPARALSTLQYSTSAAACSGVSVPQIEAHQRLGPGQLAPGHEFIGAHLIGVQRVPSFVEHVWTAFLGTNAVQPVVPGNEIAAGIANDWHT
jgi:hypothetical protein